MNNIKQAVIRRVIEEHLEQALDIPTAWIEDEVTTSRFWMDKVEPLLREHVTEIMLKVISKKIDIMVHDLMPKVIRELERAADP